MEKSCKAPTEGLEHIVFDTANTYTMAMDFCTNVEAFIGHIGINFWKMLNEAEQAI